jgi:mono/diheme cytochrome c family protein
MPVGSSRWLQGLVAGSAAVCLTAGLLAAPQTAGGNAEAARLTNPVPVTPESIAAGQAIYRRRCAGCHGADGKGGPPKEEFLKAASNLVDDQWDHGSTDGEIFAVIKNGVPPDLVMEGWGDRLSDTDIWNVVNFLRDLAKKGK